MSTNPLSDGDNLPASDYAPTLPDDFAEVNPDDADIIARAECRKNASPKVDLGNQAAPPIEYSDDALADEFTARHSRTLKYTAERRDKWFHWARNGWQPDKV